MDVYFLEREKKWKHHLPSNHPGPGSHFVYGKMYICLSVFCEKVRFTSVLSAMPVCKLHVFHPVILLYISCVVDEMFNAPILGNLPCPEKNPGCVPGQLVFLSHNNFQTTHQHHRNMS